MITEDVILGTGVKIHQPTLVNLYGCKIGDNTSIGAFVEIQKGVVIGKNCKIQSHTFICEGVIIEDNCFIGHGVKFINDLYPQATTEFNELEKEKDWKDRLVETNILNNVSIGSNSTILGGIEIGVHSRIGAGSVVTKDVKDYITVVGNPAKALRGLNETV